VSATTSSVEVEDEVVATESAGRPVCLVLSRGAFEHATATPGPGLARVRSQAAIVRALTDHMRHVDPDEADGRSAQLVEAMTRLTAGREGD